MTAQEWARIKEWFNQASEEPDPAHRERIVAEAEKASPTLAAELRSLLQEHSAPELHTLAVMEQFPGQEAAEAAEPAGGPYQLLRELGRGGTGVVYLAERRDDEFHRRVALKTLRYVARDDGSRQMLTAERRVLAQMQHPHIATLLDWGIHPDGTSWLVTEYIEGQPIDAWCRGRQLDVGATVVLFRQVCEAVRHAHHRLVVHQDLKPANILVDADGNAKLLDFGVSRSLAEPAAASPEARGFTPAYASPEQMQGGAVTAASDVYSLGVILYELLTGKLPRQPAAAPPSAAAPARRRTLRGDLDAIILRALAPEPENRYPSVGPLIQDLDAWRRGFSVSAAPSGMAGRGWRFVKRNLVACALAATAVVALAAGSVVSWLNARAAQGRFDDVKSLAHWVVFDAHDDIRLIPGTLALRRELLQEAALYLDRLSAEHPRDDGLLKEMAETYLRVGYDAGGVMGPNMGDTALSLRNYRAALTILDGLWRRHPGDEWIGTERFAAAYQLSHMVNDPEAALAFLRPYLTEADAWAKRDASGGPLQSDDLLHAARARALRAAGRLPEALAELDLAGLANQRAQSVARGGTAPLPMFGITLGADQNIYDRGLEEYARGETLLDMGRNADAGAAAARAQALFDRAAGMGRPGPSDRRMYVRVRGLEVETSLAASRPLPPVEVLSRDELNAATANAGDGTLTSQRNLAEAWRHTAHLRLARHNPTSALEALQHALALERQLAAADPVLLLNRLLLAATLNDAGNILAATDPGAARAQFSRAGAIVAAALRQAPSSADLLRERGRAASGQARLNPPAAQKRPSG